MICLRIILSCQETWNFYRNSYNARAYARRFQSGNEMTRRLEKSSYRTMRERQPFSLLQLKQEQPLHKGLRCKSRDLMRHFCFISWQPRNLKEPSTFPYLLLVFGLNASRQSVQLSGSSMANKRWPEIFSGWNIGRHVAYSSPLKRRRRWQWLPYFTSHSLHVNVSRSCIDRVMRKYMRKGE